MDLGLDGKRAAVMAASDGLGRACALALAREGARVAICARGKAKLEQAAKGIASETGAEVVAIPADVGRAADVRRFVDEAGTRLGGLDILVTNKGGPPVGRFTDLDDVAWQEGVELVVMSYIRAVRAALPHFRRAGGGVVVAIESITIKQPIPQLVVSNALRPAVAALSKSLALEHGREGIRFNVVLPGSMDTDRIRDVAEAEAREQGITVEQAMQARTRAIPVGRLGQPIELGDLVAFLASPRAAYLTGAVVQLDGGASRGTM